MRTWSGAGVSVLVCTRGAAIEMNWSWFMVFQYLFKRRKARIVLNVLFSLLSYIGYLFGEFHKGCQVENRLIYFLYLF